MKVGIVTPYFFPHPGGVSVHVYYQYIHLKKLGFDVKIISPNFGRTELVQNDHIKLGRPIPIIYNGSLTYISFSFKAKEVLRTERFDLIHVHEPYSPFSLWFIKNFKRNLGTFHAFKEEPEKILVKISKPFLSIMRKNIGVAIAVSRTSAKIIKNVFGIHEEKIKIVPNGVDFFRFSSAEPLPEFQDGKFNILFVGRLEPRKGVKHLIRAYRTVRKIIPESRLIIAGGGMKTYYLSFITEDIEKNVLFLGKVPNEFLPRIYKSADICVFPSTRGESFGIVILEALSAGKPVISGNAEGYVEILQNGKYGVIVNPKDEDSLARAIVELYFREDRRKELAEKGREYAMRFDWHNIAKQLVRVYHEVLGTEKRIRAEERN